MSDKQELYRWQDKIEKRLRFASERRHVIRLRLDTLEADMAERKQLADVAGRNWNATTERVEEIEKRIDALDEDARALYIAGAARSKRLRKLEAAKGAEPDPDPDTVAVPVAVLKQMRSLMNSIDILSDWEACDQDSETARLYNTATINAHACQIVDMLAEYEEGSAEEMPLVRACLTGRQVELNPEAGSVWTISEEYGRMAGRPFVYLAERDEE